MLVEASYFITSEQRVGGRGEQQRAAGPTRPWGAAEGVDHWQQEVREGEEPEGEEGEQDVELCSALEREGEGEEEEGARQEEDKFQKEVDVDVRVLRGLIVLEIPELEESERADDEEVDGAEHKEWQQ